MSLARTLTVFLDRDGTINRKPPEGSYVIRPEELELLTGAATAIRRLNDAGATVVVVTNQRGVARGLMSESELGRIHTRMREALGAEGAHVDAVYSCVHERGECQCRKPQPGLLTQAMAEYPEIAGSRLVMVGDSVSDVEAGRAVGATTVLIGESSGAAAAASPAYIAESIGVAVDWILTR